VPFLLFARILPNYQGGDLVYELIIALVIIISYGIVFLYWPFSFIMMVLFHSKLEKPELFEFIFFLLHSYLALSIAHNGIFGLSGHVDYISPPILGWLVVIVIKGYFVGKTFMNSGSSKPK
jgi:hypothetical protein